MKILILLTLIIFTNNAQAQNTITAIVKDNETKKILMGANCVLKGTTIGSSADINGKIILQNIPVGKRTLQFSYVGYKTVEKEFEFPLRDTSSVIIFLEPDLTLEPVTVFRCIADFLRD